MIIEAGWKIFQNGEKQPTVEMNIDLTMQNYNSLFFVYKTGQIQFCRHLYTILTRRERTSRMTVGKNWLRILICICILRMNSKEEKKEDAQGFM